MLVKKKSISVERLWNGCRAVQWNVGGARSGAALEELAERSAERLWSDPRCGTGQAPACDMAAADAKNRSHALACHWSLWGMPTFDRAPCADWPCSTPGGSLELTPVVMPFTCASSWSVVPE